MIAGMLIATLIVVLSFFLMPYSIPVFFIILFGLVFSTYLKTRQMSEDIKQIKGKLGLLSEEERTDLGIQAYRRLHQDSEWMSNTNQEIEEELEKDNENGRSNRNKK
ncbi:MULTISPECIES: hypothetical protein [Paenibacillus]|uniref:Uncharacterized protein n=2 Tax=Paenibacillus TaxID=44249 RepID=A0A268EHP3_9BACL|nr:hypothetical protein [Paenibacillus campinasensis]MUG67302.1 hypothetical protein [Paenibacillus campinasensis]PAD72653.1 hypothetical protein CHH67_21535 [Paenibacillus campinasensis]PAK51130.1 hypothetical protein CHH75_15525 [Paenibacillus sp. 7541]